MLKSIMSVTQASKTYSQHKNSAEKYCNSLAPTLLCFHRRGRFEGTRNTSVGSLFLPPTSVSNIELVILSKILRLYPSRNGNVKD